MQEILAKYNPGLNAQEFTLGGAAKFIAAGSDIVFEIHYTTSGRPETDRSKVGIVFAAGPPQQRYVTTTGINNNRFVIPGPCIELRGEGGDDAAGRCSTGLEAVAIRGSSPVG